MMLVARRASRVKEPLLAAVLDNRVDFGVFNMKDLRAFEEASNLIIGAIPERSSPYDVLVSREGTHLKKLRHGSTVGASRLLRIVQLRKMRPDLKVEAISGTVKERLLMLDRAEVDAIVLAESGLARLGMSGRITERLSLDDFMPAPGQGVTALVCRRDDQKTLRLLRPVDNIRTRREAEAEQELARLVRAQLRVPLGAYATTSGDRLHLSACMVSSDGQDTVRVSGSGPANNPSEVATRVAASLFEQGASRLEDGWRKLYPLSDD